MKFALPGRPVNQKVVVSAVFVAAMFMNIMDGTVVSVALPTLSRYFGAPIGSVSGVVIAYLVALAVAMPASGWVGDRFGGRSVLLAPPGRFGCAIVSYEAQIASAAKLLLAAAPLMFCIVTAHALVPCAKLVWTTTPAGGAAMPQV